LVRSVRFYRLKENVVFILKHFSVGETFEEHKKPNHWKILICHEKSVKDLHGGKKQLPAYKKCFYYKIFLLLLLLYNILSA
jgi:hypothetical protein